MYLSEIEKNIIVSYLKDNLHPKFIYLFGSFAKGEGRQVPIDPFISDVEKSIKYIRDKDLKEIQFYLGFIHEGEFATSEISWLKNKKQERMVQGRLTELSACYYEDKDEMIYTIISYNDMNKDLDTYANQKR